MSAGARSGHVAVFTYGSLMYDAVWGALVPAGGRSVGARLEGWRRHALREATYPGIVPAQGHRVEGRLWLEVAPAGLARLDAFEGSEYRRETVRVQPLDGSAACDAEVWAWLDGGRLLDHDWDARAFERDHLAGFARRHGA